MTDICRLLKEEIAATAGGVLGIGMRAGQIGCPAASCLARSAIPLAMRADAGAYAQALTERAARFSLFGRPLIKNVGHHNGHLLFYAADAFYDAALAVILKELPPIAAPGSAWHQEALPARLLYTKRRMWMLSRKADGCVTCPADEAARRALLLTAAIYARGLTRRALELRMLEASDALLTMTHHVTPYLRPRFCARCAHVADAAARVIHWGLTR
ncbi:MAG: hypothetical protein LBS18_07205 [Clostridiales bacterium]|nr:hypothetical protein [Clostridiales bacterium]